MEELKSIPEIEKKSEVTLECSTPEKIDPTPVVVKIEPVVSEELNPLLENGKGTTLENGDKKCAETESPQQTVVVPTP